MIRNRLNPEWRGIALRLAIGEAFAVAAVWTAVNIRLRLTHGDPRPSVSTVDGLVASFRSLLRVDRPRSPWPATVRPMLPDTVTYW